MKIFTGTFLLTTAVLLLHFFELICSEPSTLDDLFPGYNGSMPPIEKVWFHGQFRKFKTYDDTYLKYIPIGLVKRGHIIFGGYRDQFISDLYQLFRSLEPAFFVFDINKDEWVTVPRDLSRKLGADRFLPLILAREEVAAKHVSTSKIPVYKEGHIRAYQQANDRVEIVENEQMELMLTGRSSLERAIIKIKEEYGQVYNREFTRYLYQHGEYNINGHIERPS